VLTVPVGVADTVAGGGVPAGADADGVVGPPEGEAEPATGGAAAALLDGGAEALPLPLGLVVAAPVPLGVGARVASEEAVDAALVLELAVGVGTALLLADPLLVLLPLLLLLLLAVLLAVPTSDVVALAVADADSDRVAEPVALPLALALEDSVAGAAAPADAVAVGVGCALRVAAAVAAELRVAVAVATCDVLAVALPHGVALAVPTAEKVGTAVGVSLTELLLVPAVLGAALAVLVAVGVPGRLLLGLFVVLRLPLGLPVGVWEPLGLLVGLRLPLGLGVGLRLPVGDAAGVRLRLAVQLVDGEVLREAVALAAGVTLGKVHVVDSGDACTGTTWPGDSMVPKNMVPVSGSATAPRSMLSPLLSATPLTRCISAPDGCMAERRAVEPQLPTTSVSEPGSYAAACPVFSPATMRNASTRANEVPSLTSVRRRTTIVGLVSVTAHSSVPPASRMSCAGLSSSSPSCTHEATAMAPVGPDGSVTRTTTPGDCMQAT
jgi:hypothetical protein